MRPGQSFVVQTFNGLDKAQPKRGATILGLQERGPVWKNASPRMWYPAGLQEAMGWNPLRFKLAERGKVQLHKSGRALGHPNTTPARWALWVAGYLDGYPCAFINTHLINNAFGPDKRGNRRLRRRLWRQGWREVKKLRRELWRQGWRAVFILGDLNRGLRWWQKLNENTVAHGYDHIIYPAEAELIDWWLGDANGSDHRPVFARFRLPAVEGVGRP